MSNVKLMIKVMIMIIVIGLGAYMVFDSLHTDKPDDNMNLLIDALKKFEPKEPPYIEDIWIRIQNRKVGV